MKILEEIILSGKKTVYLGGGRRRGSEMAGCTLAAPTAGLPVCLLSPQLPPGFSERIIFLLAQHQRPESYLHTVQFCFKLGTRCSSLSPFQGIMMCKSNTRFKFMPYHLQPENTIYLSPDCQVELAAFSDLPFSQAFLCSPGKC